MYKERQELTNLPQGLVGKSRIAARILLRLPMLVCVCVLLFVSLSHPVMAAESSEAGWGIWETIGRFVNLFLLFGVLFYFIRKPLNQFFKNRRNEIHERLNEAERRRQEAEEKIQQIEQRMAAIEQELSAIRRRSQQEATEEARRMEEATRQEGDKILAVARREIDGIVKTARKELRFYAGSLSVKLAQEMIEKSITDNDQERIFIKFRSEIERMK